MRWAGPTLNAECAYLPFGQGQNLPQDVVALISINAVAGPGV
jgi:hypothetical protein